MLEKLQSCLIMLFWMSATGFCAISVCDWRPAPCELLACSTFRWSVRIDVSGSWYILTGRFLCGLIGGALDSNVQAELVYVDGLAVLEAG